MTFSYPLCRKASQRPNIKKKKKKISVLLVLPSSIVYILIANLSMKVYIIITPRLFKENALAFSFNGVSTRVEILAPPCH